MRKSLRLGLVTALGLTTIAATTTTGAFAQDGDQVKELLACDEIKDPEDRLECFNAVIEILKAQDAAKRRGAGTGADADLMRRRSVEEDTANRSDFGFTAAEVRRREQARGSSPKEPKEQTFRFSRTWQDAVGKYYFLMTNGQIWKEVGGSHLIVPKRAETIRIKRNMMGGYSAFVEGLNGRRGKVKRVR